MMSEANSTTDDFEQVGEHEEGEEQLYPTLPSNTSHSSERMSLHNATEVVSDDDEEAYHDAQDSFTFVRGSPPQMHVPGSLTLPPPNFQLQVEQEDIKPQEQATTFNNFETTTLKIETTPATPVATDVTLHHPQAKRISVELASPYSPENYQSQTVKLKSSSAFNARKADYKEHSDRKYFEQISGSFRPYSASQFQEITKEEEKEIKGYYALCISGRQGPGKPGQSGVAGANGSPGTNGKNGADGVNGEPGEDGDNGKNGYNGSNGTPGYDGENGQDAESVYLMLEGDPENLKISGSHNETVKLPIVQYNDKSEHRGVVWIDASGSAGGSGGKGGDGGSGGKGGEGGRGGNGSDASLPNQSGGTGGKGGDGGNGGNGGSGGSGGKAGHGGDGGSILVETSDSRLLMLVEVDIRGGKGGRGGAGGEGGIGGEEGRGGECGKGGKGSTRAKDGCDGSKGKSGSTGNAGSAGQRGADGNSGLPGSIFFIVRDTHNNIKEQGYKRYNVKVTNYTIRGAIDDGVFEPGEEVIIENIQLTNDGDLELPEGATMSIAKSDTFEGLQSQFIAIPAIKPNESLTLSNVSLKGRIVDVPVATKGRYHGTAEITPVTQLLSRTFQDSLLTRAIDVRYPLRVERQYSPSVMGLDDVKEFRLEISNVSNATYGSESVGTISYRIVLEPSLQLVDTEHSKNIIEGTIKELASRNIANVSFKVRMTKDTPYFERVKWRAELILRGKTIEYAEKEVRAAPHFESNTASTDLLFISSSSMSKREYLIYKRVFDGLGLRPNFYDIEMYNGLSPEENGLNPYQEIVRVNWVGKFQGKPIVFPLSTTEDMKLLKGNHIIQHFVSSEREKTDKLDSGMVIVGAVQLKKYIEDLMEECYNSTTYTEEISEENFSDYFVYNSPTRAFMQQRLAKIESDKKKEHPSQLFIAKHTLYEPKRLRLTLYSYGKAVVKQLPLNRLHKLMFVTHGDETAAHTPYFLTTGESEEKDLLEPSKNMFKMDSRFFEVLLAIVCSLSVEKKLDLLKGQNPASNSPWRFTKSPKEKIDFFDVIRTALYEDLKREYFFKDQGLSRAERLINYVKKNKQEFLFEAGIYSIWYVISRFTSHTFWRSLPFVSDFNEKRTKLLKLQESLEKELFQNGNPSIPASLSEESLGTTVGSSKVVFAQDVKKKAVEDAEDASRLKLQDLTKRLVFPLYDLNL